MLLHVIRRDSAGTLISDDDITISDKALFKSIGLAAQGFAPKSHRIRRAIGFMLYFAEYLNATEMAKGRFVKPPPQRRDPTETGQFANILGRAIADRLARKFGGARCTYPYESYMKKKKGGRADLICDANTHIFAVEAKGFSSSGIGDDKMVGHKDQSKKGGVSVEYSVASVTYNIFKRATTKYYDPDGDNYAYDDEASRHAAMQFYGGVLSYFESRHFEIENYVIGDRNVFALYPRDEAYLISRIGSCLSQSLHFGRIGILIDPEFKLMAHQGIGRMPEEPIETDEAFLDSDGLGVVIHQTPRALPTISYGKRLLEF